MTLAEPEQASETTHLPDPPHQVTRQHRIIDLVLVLFIGFSGPLSSALFLFFFPVKANTFNVNGRFISGLLHEIGALVLFFLLLQRQGRKLKEIGLAFHWLDALSGLALYLVSFVTYYVCATVFQFGYYFWNQEYFQYRNTDAMVLGASMVLMTGYTVAAPFFEEILVRGYLMTELTQLSWPTWLAVMASVLLQTSYHLYYGLAGALIVGTTFGMSAIYFAWRRRLWPVILSHLIWDVVATYRHFHH